MRMTFTSQLKFFFLFRFTEWMLLKCPYLVVVLHQRHCLWLRWIVKVHGSLGCFWLKAYYIHSRSEPAQSPFEKVVSVHLFCLNYNMHVFIHTKKKVWTSQGTPDCFKWRKCSKSDLSLMFPMIQWQNP